MQYLVPKEVAGYRCDPALSRKLCVPAIPGAPTLFVDTIVEWSNKREEQAWDEMFADKGLEKTFGQHWWRCPCL